LTSRGILTYKGFLQESKGHCPAEEEPWLVTHSLDKNGVCRAKIVVFQSMKVSCVTETLLETWLCLVPSVECGALLLLLINLIPDWLRW